MQNNETANAADHYDLSSVIIPPEPKEKEERMREKKERNKREQRNNKQETKVSETHKKKE